jgi:hypothetical protein|tara:strand:- start:17266 stop:17466 length:201 start_codon:yes stop_codon:yes gene_type:complete
MSLAREVNKLLDELSVQIKTDEQIGVGEIKEKLNKLTRDGEIIKDIFTNDYYVNNMILDKVVAEKS